MSTAPTEIELELCWFGMKTDDEGDKVLAERHEEIESVDIEVHVRIEARGEIIPIVQFEDLPPDTALFNLFETLFPDTSHNILPQ